MNARQQMYFNIPEELRKNYCNWKYEDVGGFKPTKVPYNSKMLDKRASLSNSSTYSMFETAVEASIHFDGIGKMLTNTCGFYVIDLDDAWEKVEGGAYKYANPQEVENRQILIFNSFPGYWERSISGKGVHGWGYCDEPFSGRRREGVEIYTNHFMIMTGDVVSNHPLMNHTSLLRQLWLQLGKESTGTSGPTDIAGLTKAQLHEDYEICNMAASASNGLKFIELYEGRWADIYPSQSEADQTLCNYLCYYTQNVEQIIRIFKASALGKTLHRKAKPDNYLMNPKYGLLPKAFDKTLPAVDLDTLRNNLEEQLASKRETKTAEPLILDSGANLKYAAPEPEIPAQQPQTATAVNRAISDPYLNLSPVENGLCRANLEAAFLGSLPESGRTNLIRPFPTVSLDPVPISRPVEYPSIDISKKSNIKSSIPLPPGIIGDIAKFIYSSAPRPSYEIAIMGAIGLAAGVCGRAYNVSGTGLNLYAFLLGNTGCGKEGMSSGIDKLMSNVYKTVPAAVEFIGPSEIASPQALTKYISKTSKSFVSLVGEFSIKLKQICSPTAHSNEIGLKRAFLDLYTKSGQGKTLGKMIYSDKDKNTEVITGPAFSLLGEGTPEKFYEMLNKEMIEEGLLPRFLIIEYKGKRPPLNVNHGSVQPPVALVDYFSSIAAYCLQLNNGNNVLDVQCDAESQAMFDKYNEKCDHAINTGNEISRQLWNRAHLKALKLAALIAVGVNYINPIINAESAKWALDIVTSDIKNLLGRFETGEVGVVNIQNEQVVEIRRALKAYVSKDWSEVQSYPGASLATHNLKIVPHSFISSLCRTKTCFKTDKIGPIGALKTCLMSMIESGDIVELSPMDKRNKGLTTTAKLYMIVNFNSL